MSKFDNKAILRPTDISEYLGISRSKLNVYLEQDPTFPRKIKLSTRRVGFLKDSVDAWLKAKEAEGV